MGLGGEGFQVRHAWLGVAVGGVGVLGLPACSGRVPAVGRTPWVPVDGRTPRVPAAELAGVAGTVAGMVVGMADGLVELAVGVGVEVVVAVGTPGTAVVAEALGMVVGIGGGW